MLLKPALFASSLIALTLGSLQTHAEINYSDESIKRGAMLFAMNCTSCHGSDGKATINFVSDATNLTDPTQYRGGDTRAHIFNAIKNGQAVDMPSFEWVLDGDEEMWDLTNFVMSLWPEETRNAALNTHP